MSIQRPDSGSNRIDQINTEYTKIIRVLGEPVGNGEHDEPETPDSPSFDRKKQRRDREEFIRRYEKAIKAFIGKKTGDRNLVEPIWDLFLDKCLSGKLSKYSPDIGSFRYYLKKVLRTTCLEYQRGLGKERMVQMDTQWAASVENEDIQAETEFDQSLADSIFERALQSISISEPTFHHVLKLVTSSIAKGRQQPDSDEIANSVSQLTNKPTTPENARQIKSRASKAFANQIIEEVSELIGSSDLNEIESALIDIGILKYCKNALARRRS